MYKEMNESINKSRRKSSIGKQKGRKLEEVYKESRK
jgi:hypothetical protein